MKPVSIKEDTYEELKRVQEFLNNKLGGYWSYDEIIRRSLALFKKEVGFDGE